MRPLLRTVSVTVTLFASACSSDTLSNGADTAVNTTLGKPAETTPAPSTVTPTTTTPTTVTPTTVPVTTPLSPEQVVFTSVAKVPDALDLAYRSGDDTLFVASRDGFVSAIRDGEAAPKHVLDIRASIVSGGEQGLLGLTFATDGQYAYVDYTNTDGDTVIAEFAVGADGVFDRASQRILLKIAQPYANHNGGSVKIGPDGYLYIGMGDGGAGGDPQRNALNTEVLLGKILRIDPTPSANMEYTIPADNPLVGIAAAKPEIWSTGVRNPWRLSFDRSTGDLWIADVGQDAWEEINVAWADQGGGRGANFGWSAFEGTHNFNSDQSAPDVAMPIFEYPHGDAGCSISGGVRYRGTAIASLAGWYVYGDYCSGQVRALEINSDRSAGREVTLTREIAGLSAVAQGPDGELYALSVDSGTVFALQSNSR